MKDQFGEIRGWRFQKDRSRINDGF